MNILRRQIAVMGAMAALLVSTVAYAGTITLNDGTESLVCQVSGSITISSTGNLTASVPADCFDSVAGSGGGGSTGPYTLTVNLTGEGAVTSSPAGIACDNTGGTCSADFADGTSVSLSRSGSAGDPELAWGGSCGGAPNACSVTMSANRTVTAEFTDPGNGGGGGNQVGGDDPGFGGGLWQPDLNTYVFDIPNDGDLYVPRCVPDNYENCRYGGNNSAYDTIKAGEVWSMRIPHNITGTGSGWINTLRAETGESVNAFDASLSEVPGDFDNVPANCRKVNGGLSTKITVALAGHPYAAIFKYCELEPGKMYYYNVRPAAGTPGETVCGNNESNACRVRSYWNSLQIDYGN